MRRSALFSVTVSQEDTGVMQVAVSLVQACKFAAVGQKRRNKFTGTGKGKKYGCSHSLMRKC